MCYLLLNYAGMFHLGTSSPTTTKQTCSNAYDKGTLDVKIVFLYSPLCLRLVCIYPCYRQLVKQGLKQ